MNTIKDKIKSQFNQAVMTYDLSCHVQVLAIEKLLEMILNERADFQVVADLACGTGESTIRLLKSIQYQHAVAVDLADELLNLTVTKCSHYPLQCFIADFDDVIFKDDSFNLIVANMGLQWSLQLQRTLQQIYCALKSRGRLAFSIPLSDTFIELPVNKRNHFYREGQIIDFLKIAGFNQVDYQEVIERQFFTSPYSRAKAIKAVGASTVLSCPGEVLTSSYSRSKQTEAGHYALTYRIGLFLATKD